MLSLKAVGKNVELVIKEFSELTTDELFEILKLRVTVFVVEQNCCWQEIDDFDRQSIHVYLKDSSGILAYLRVVPSGLVCDDVSIGRVIAAKRRCGLGTRVLSEGIKAAKEKFNADVISIEAQSYAKEFYEKAGFVQTSEEFLDTGIPHIQMKLKIN